MTLRKLFNKTLWIDSLPVAIGIIAAIESLLAICDLGVKDFVEISSWWVKLSIISITFLVILVIVVISKFFCSYNAINLKINNVDVTIKEGDIFSDTKSWKVIPFNEYFDTEVDDVIIAHNSLNGKLIDGLSVKSKKELQSTIEKAPLATPLCPKKKNGRNCYQLGSIIVFQKFLLLAFSHFDNKNQAILTHSQYEKCLRSMWHEISRTYANQPVCLPLLGGGITRFENPNIKKDSQLLTCILCTLKTSGASINQPITIYVTKETLNKLDLYQLRRQFK